MCSAKLERWEECGLGLEPILSAGGGVRPIEDTELLRDGLFTSTASLWSAMVSMQAYCEMRGSARRVLAGLRASSFYVANGEMLRL